MFQHHDDITREELDTQNQEVIGFLNRVYSVTDEPATRQAVTRVRERLQREGHLQANLQRSHLHLVEDQETFEQQSIVSKPQRPKGFRRSFGLLSAIAVLTIVVGGSFLLMSRMPQTQSGSGGTPHPGTPAPTTNPTPTPGPGTYTQADEALQQLRQEIDLVDSKYVFVNKYDSKSYLYTYGYTNLAKDLYDRWQRRYISDRETIDQAQNALFNLKLLEGALGGQNPQEAGKQLLSHYGLQNQTVIVVSTARQTLEFYQNGVWKYVISVSTGRMQVPDLPGCWQTQWRVTKTIFKSSYPKGSPLWYQDREVLYAIEYHAGGYFLYGSKDRTTFGPGSQFPHKGPIFDNDGAVGGIEMSLADAQRLFDNTNDKTYIIIY